MGSSRWGRRFGWGVHARHRLDISVIDVGLGLLACCGAWWRVRLEAEVLGRCYVEEGGLVSYSVRSGWDLWLGAQGLRVGNEVIVSAVTHPDMVRIIRSHGLRAVPVDIEPETLAPGTGALEAAITPRTRVVLVAHLFGGRMDLDPVVRFARKHGLLLAEDCAQAFQGPEAVADTPADVSMYSFGTLKTSTALGGAILRVREEEVLRRMRDAQGVYPVQRRRRYLKKLLGALGLVLVSRPWPYGLLTRACAWLGSDLDARINSVVRAFPAHEPEAAFFRRLRQRPCAPLLAMLLGRLRTFDRERLAGRASAGESLARRLRVVGAHPGGSSSTRTHWLFPVVVEDPGSLILKLRDQGLDASQATSSIGVVRAPAGYPSPAGALRMMSGIVFLPARPDLPPQTFDVMAALVNDAVPDEAVEKVEL